MEVLGALAILFAFCLSIYAVIGVFTLVTIASGILVYFLTTSDFRLAYVAAHSNRAMPVMYKFASWWGGQEGSLLLWSWLLSVYSTVVVWTNRKRHTGMMPWVVAVLQLTQIFFLVLNAFVEPPFHVLAVGRGVQAMPDGQGLNPLLQYWMMAIHPPMLYLGYVGFIVPFAFAMGSLITKQKGDAWIHTTRRWSLITWSHTRSGLGLCGAWLGRLLGLGSGGKRIAAALDYGHCLFAFGDDAGEEGHDEGVEHGPGVHDLLPVHLRDISDSLGIRQFGACLRRIVDRLLVPGVPCD